MGTPIDQVSPSTSKNAVGYRAWCLDYANSIIDPKVLQAHVDSFMADFEEREAEEKAAERRRRGEPDADGWITVTRHGRRKGAPRTEAAALHAVEKKSKKAQATLTNFYTFQTRESKLKRLDELRRKFEEDKKKIASLRAKTKFKPY